MDTDPPPASGAIVVAWGAGGLYASDPERRQFTRVTDVPPDSVNVGGAAITARHGDTATAYDPATGQVTASFTFACPTGALVDALLANGRAYGICEIRDESDRYAVLGAADGSTTDLGVHASTLQADQGGLYVGVDWGRGGTELYLADPATLAPLTQSTWVGFQAEARGDHWFAFGGEYGNSDAGDVQTGTWSTGAFDGAILPTGEFVEQLDVVDGQLALVAAVHYGDPTTHRAILMKLDGTVTDELAGCASPRLIAGEGDALEGWCASPPTRTTWSTATWDVNETQAYGDVDASRLLVLEPGD